MAKSMETTEILSTQNNLVKYLVKLQNPKFRKQEKRILLDGEKTILGLIEDGVEFEYIFLLKNSDLINKVKAKNLILTNENVLKKISTTKSYSKTAAVIKEKIPNKSIFAKLNKIALIEGIKDAGNLGTIIRSAAAFSIDGIIVFGSTIDIYNPKVIRSSAQNMFKIPIIKTNDLDFITELKKDRSFISTVVNSEKDLLNYKFKDKFIIAFGSEADGLSNKILDLSDEKLSLKIDNNVESINLAVCCSVVFALIKYKL